MNQTVKWILIALAVIAVLIIIIVTIKYFSEGSTTNPSAPPAPTPSAGGTGGAVTDILGNLLTGVGNLLGLNKRCDKDNPGFQKDGTYNPDKCGVAAGLECDPNRPGWNMGGLMDPTC